MSAIIINHDGSALATTPEGSSLVTDENGAPCCCGDSGGGPPPPPPPGTGRFVTLRPCGGYSEPCGGPMYFDRLGIPPGTPTPGPVIRVLCGSVSVCACWASDSNDRPAGVEVTIGDSYRSCCACVVAKAIDEGRDPPCCPRDKYSPEGVLTKCCCGRASGVTMTGTYREVITEPGQVPRVTNQLIQNVAVVEATPCFVDVSFDMLQVSSDSGGTQSTIIRGCRMRFECGDGVQTKPTTFTQDGATYTRINADVSDHGWTPGVSDATGVQAGRLGPLPCLIGSQIPGANQPDDMTLSGQGFVGGYSQGGSCSFYSGAQALRFDGPNGSTITYTNRFSITLNYGVSSECFGCYEPGASAAGCAGCGASLNAEPV